MFKENVKKNKILISIAVFLIFVFSIFFFVVESLVGKIKENASEIQKRLADEEANQSRIANLPEMEKVANLINDKQENLNVILNSAEESEKLEFIKQLENIARETDNEVSFKVDENKNQLVKKQALTPASAEKGGDAKAVQKKDESIKGNLKYDKFIIMQVSLQGRYRNFVDFLNRLEDFNYYVNPISFNLIKAEDERIDENMSAAPPTQEIIKKEILKSNLELVVYIKK